MRWSLSTGGWEAVIMRLVCSTVLMVPSIIIAAAFMGQGVILGLAFAVVPAYLVWAWIADAVALVRSLRAPVEYQVRRGYRAFALLSALSLPAYWLWKWLSDPTWGFPSLVSSLAGFAAAAYL